MSCNVFAVWGPCFVQVVPAVCLVMLSLLVIIPCQFVCYIICCCVMIILFVSYCLNADLDKRFKVVCSRWSCKCLCNVICVCICVQEYMCVLVCLHVCVHMYVYIGKLDGYYSAWPCNTVAAIYIQSYTTTLMDYHAHWSRLMVVSREAKKKQYARVSSGLRDHYSKLFTQMAALNF